MPKRVSIPTDPFSSKKSTALERLTGEAASAEAPAYPEPKASKGEPLIKKSTYLTQARIDKIEMLAREHRKATGSAATWHDVLRHLIDQSTPTDIADMEV